jgi:hypothetical protein
MSPENHMAHFEYKSNIGTWINDDKLLLLCPKEETEIFLWGGGSLIVGYEPRAGIIIGELSSDDPMRRRFLIRTNQEGEMGVFMLWARDPPTEEPSVYRKPKGKDQAKPVRIVVNLNHCKGASGRR